MENSYETLGNGKSTDPGLQIIRRPSYQSCTNLSLPWFDIRVFYVRISNFLVDDSTPECLTVNHIPLSPDTLLEVNGVRCSVCSEGISCSLRRDRIDKKSEETTFVSTDGIRLTGSVKFEVFDREVLVLSGILEMSNRNGFTGDSKGNGRRWSMNCESLMNTSTGFLKGKQIVGSESLSPTIEVYVAGCFSGTPIILTKTLQLTSQRKHNRKGMLDSIPEYEAAESQKDAPSGLDLQWIYHLYAVGIHSEVRTHPLPIRQEEARTLNRAADIAEYKNYKIGNEEDCNNFYWRRIEYIEGEDGELTWFNAGVRVGVGLGLGICLGVGIGIGLLVRTYQTTSRTFRRRLP